MIDDFEYKLVAPDVDALLRYFDRGFLNPETPSQTLMTALDELIEVLKPLAPHKDNDEAKVLWIMVPRGTIEDYGSFEDAKMFDEVKTYEEFEELWKVDYPDEEKWYRLTIGVSKPESRFKFRSVAIDNNGIVNAHFDDGVKEESDYKEIPALTILPLLTEAAKKSIQMLQNGTYNDYVRENLPIEHRTGVLKRSDWWAVNPEVKEQEWKDMDEGKYRTFKSLLPENSREKIQSIVDFTANDFFRACKLGYEACGYDVEGMTPVQTYIRYADGRDEGLTGTGHGLNEGPGIDFDNPKAWNEWYNSDRGGGHPWEVVRGGNSTHVELYVWSDEHELGWQLRTGKISQEEYDKGMENAGYYFQIAGKHRAEESISFYVALREAGLPVLISDAEEIVARYDGTDNVGIVPHRVFPRYCEDMFPEEYGAVIDFMHVYRGSEDDQFIPYIKWLPEDEAELAACAVDGGNQQ